VVSEETIAETLREYAEPEQCVERLVSLALRGGGPDNITVIVADTTDEDIVEATPIVGGAAARPDPTAGLPASGGAGTPPESTPAARASALNQPVQATAPAPETEPVAGAGVAGEEAPRPPRHPVRNLLVFTALLALLGGGLWYGWSVIQSNYYVGATEEGEIAVFRGVPGRVAGLELSSYHSGSGTDIEELTPTAQETVRQGTVRADSPQEAMDRMASLIRENRQQPERAPVLPPPTTPPPTTPPPTSPAPRPSGSASTADTESLGTLLPPSRLD